MMPANKPGTGPARLLHKFQRLQETSPRLFGFMNWSPVGMEPFYRLVRAELPLRPGDSTLDFGCGRGALTSIFEPPGYLGVEINPAFAAYARRRHPRHAVAVANGTRLSLKSAHFNAVVVIGVLHHLDTGSSLAALHEARRVLRPGGRALIIEPVPPLSRWNLIGRAVKSLDLGHFIRPIETWHSMVGQVFTVTNHYPHRIGFNDLAVLVGRRP